MDKYLQLVDDAVGFIELFVIAIVVTITAPIWLPARFAYRGVRFLMERK